MTSQSPFSGPLSKLIALCLLIFGCASIAAGVSAALLDSKYGVEGVGGLVRLMAEDPSSIEVVKLLQILSSLLVFVLPVLLFTYMFRFDMRFRNVRLDLFVLIPLVLVFSAPLIELLIRVNHMLVLPDFMSGIESWMRAQEKNAEALMKFFLTMDSQRDLAFNLFMIAILPAFAEELLFRGALQQLFAKWARNPHLGILFAAILFSAMHLQFYGFLPRIVLGMLFGYIFLWSGNLWMPILAHMMFNGIQVVLAWSGHLEPDEITGTPVESLPVWMLLSGMVLFALSIFYFRKRALQSQ